MKLHQRLGIMAVFLFTTCLFMGACAEKKEGKVIVTNSEFVVRQDSDKAYVIDAKGKIKNVGDVDVKNVVVTGYCRSCIEVIKIGQWFISDIEKTPEQKAVISYLPADAEEDFSFKGVAFMYNNVSERPEIMPEKMEIVIESFETVQ